ncbi:MAG: hypothetical protein II994_04460 [Lachnospiraceae bacterium]|nr:hypothetical protein [Lachnospiraceae bacterium]
MKKIKLFLMIMAMSITMAACGNASEDMQTAEGNVVESSAENATKDSGEGDDTEVKAAESDSQTEAEQATEPEKELITVEADLSAFGELVNDLFVITNDNSKKTTREEIFQYLDEKGYAFYPYTEADVDNTITREEASEKEVFDLKPESVLKYSEKPKYSHATVGTQEDVIKVIQYKMSGCSEQTVSSARELCNNAFLNGNFDGYDVEVKINGDAENWSNMYVYFYGEPADDSNVGDYFAHIHVGVGTYQTLFSFWLY